VVTQPSPSPPSTTAPQPAHKSQDAPRASFWGDFWSALGSPFH